MTLKLWLVNSRRLKTLMNCLNGFYISFWHQLFSGSSGQPQQVTFTGNKDEIHVHRECSMVYLNTSKRKSNSLCNQVIVQLQQILKTQEIIE